LSVALLDAGGLVACVACYKDLCADTNRAAGPLEGAVRRRKERLAHDRSADFALLPLARAETADGLSPMLAQLVASITGDEEVLLPRPPLEPRRRRHLVLSPLRVETLTRRVPDGPVIRRSVRGT
jgi:hypothetical protein